MPILKELHWLPVSKRIVFKLMLIVHKSVHNIAPIYISELLKVYTPSRNLRSSNMSLLKEPTSKRTWGDRSFSVAAPRLWNHLPTKLKSCHSITRFKSLLILCHNFSKMMYMYVCNCIVHVCILVHNFVFAIIVNCLYSCFFCFRALITQQGGYVCATNLYYYYYYYRPLPCSMPLDNWKAGCRLSGLPIRCGIY